MRNPIPDSFSTAHLPAIVISLASFLVTFDVTAVLVAMPQIKRDLALDVSGFAWVMDAYSLAFTVCLMSAGILADRFGRRRALIWGTMLFAAASLVCGVSWNQGSLLMGRAIQGLGSAFVICGSLALLSNRFREQAQRARAFALVGTVTGSAMALGPSGGGFVADVFGWRWVFLINLPICLIIGCTVPLVVGESRDAQLRKIDWVGNVALTLALFSAIWFLLHGTQVMGVTIPIWAAIAIPLSCAAAFLASQKLQEAPMIDLSLFANPAFVGICIVPLALSLSYWSLLVYLPLFLESGLAQSLDKVSILMLAATLPMVILPFAGAKLLLSLRPARFFSLGLGFVGASALVLAYAARMVDLPIALLGMLISGSAAALLNSQLSSAIMLYAPKEQSGVVSAIATIMRQGGFAVGIALLGMIASRREGNTLAEGSLDFASMFTAAGIATLLAAAAIFALLRARAAEEG